MTASGHQLTLEPINFLLPTLAFNRLAKTAKLFYLPAIFLIIRSTI